MNTKKRLLSVINVMMVVLLVGACSAQPGEHEQTFGEQIAGTKQSMNTQVPPTAIPPTPVPTTYVDPTAVATQVVPATQVPATETPVQPTPVPPTPVPPTPVAPTVPETILTTPVFSGNLFRSPVQCQSTFVEATNWLLCEPGILLDNTATFTRAEIEAPYNVNVPEGGFTYLSMGQGELLFRDGTVINLAAGEGLNYLIVIRGTISDGIIDTDLNQTVRVSGFIPGHAIWSPMMPPNADGAAYVSRDWFQQQLEMSSGTGGSNCGAYGCSRTHVILYDVTTRFYQKFEVRADSLTSWVLFETNVVR